MSEQTARLVDHLRDRLRRTTRRMTWADLAFGGAVFLGVLSALWLLGAALEAGLWLDPTPRTVVTSIVAASVLGVAAVFVARPLGQALGLVSPPSDVEVATRIGQKYPEVSDRLVNLLDLADGRRTHAPDAFVDQAVQHLGREIEPVEFEQVEDFSRARSALRLASVPLVGVLAFLLVAPATFLGASERLLTPTTTYQRPAPFQLTIQPGDVQLVKGDSLEISITAAGEAPTSVQLETQPVGETRTETVTLRRDGKGRYTHTLSGLRQSLRYRVNARPVRTAWYLADVTARPLVRSLQVTATPPSYTGLDARTLDPNVGDVTGLPGTTVSLRARLGGPSVTDAVLLFDDGSEAALTVTDGGVVEGEFTLAHEGTYRIRLVSNDGVANRDPIRYRLSLRADARPSVVFLSPEANATLSEDLVQPLRLRISDDYGFVRMKLYYRLAEQRFGEGQTEFSSLDLPLDAPRQVDQQIIYDWLLAQDSGLDLVPGDVVEYYVQVWDNDAFAGYKSARTAAQRLTLPSLAEKYKELDERQSTAEETMDDMKNEAESMQRQFDELQRELRRKQDADWEDQRQIEQLRKKQESLQKSAQDLARQMQDLTNKMQEDNLTSPETTQKYEELQRVIEEINSPELQDALKKLQDSMQNMDLRQMQEAMEDFEFNEEQYQERLQRTIDLFKQLKAQQKLEELARKAGDLSEVQKKLSEETAKRQESESNEASEDTSDEARESADEGDSENAPDEDAKDRESSDASPSEQAPSSEQQDQQDAETPPADAPDASESSEANEDLAREQERSAEQMKELLEEMQKLNQEMQDVPSAPKQQMQQMQQQMQRKNLPQQMQKNSEQLRQNQLQDAQQGQQQMQQQLQQMQQQMQSMQQGMQGQQQSINVAGLRYALDNTLRLSQTQESLRKTVREMSSEGPALRKYAQNQEALTTGLTTVSDSLQKLARRVPEMSRVVQKEAGSALREMDDATEALSERNAARASGRQKASMMHLNELALLLSDLLSQMQNSQGGSGGMSMQQMMQQMQQMSGQQQKLNSQIQQFLNDVQGNRLSVDQKKRLQDLAQQQQRIRQQLNELNDATKGTDLQNKIMGDLDAIAREMEKTIQELQQGSQNRRTLDRQRRILTRMLEAQRSLKTQGKKDERQGRSADDDVERTPPGELTPQEEAERLRRDLIRALESGYAPDYEELIKRYFDLLQKSESGN